MPMLAFKEPHMALEWSGADGALRRVVLTLLDQWPTEFMVITRIFDPRSAAQAQAAGESAVHCTAPHRALDARTRDLDEHVINGIIQRMNAQFVYDPTRPEKPTCYQHDAGSGRHLHIQVHPRSVEKWA